MLRVIVESASNIPKTKFGKPDPIVSVIFKGKVKFASFSPVLLWNVRFLGLILWKSAIDQILWGYSWNLLPVQVRGEDWFLWKAFDFPQGFEAHWKTGCLNSNSPWSKPCTKFQVSKCSGEKNSSVLVQIKSFSARVYIFIASACEKLIKEGKTPLSFSKCHYLVKQPLAAFIVTGLLGGGVKLLFWFLPCYFVPLCSCSSSLQS